MNPRHRSLREVFEIIADEARKDPVRHVAALTYEFDDQQLVNLLVGRPLDEAYEPRGIDLKRIAELAPVVAYDARKTREGQATPHFLELLPVRMPAYTCHHPKAYLIVLEHTVHLVIGSMNLTRTGVLANREVFLYLRCSRLETADVSVLLQFLDLLETGYADFGSEPLGTAIAGARKRLAMWPASATQTRHLVASGYGTTGLARLRQLWEQDARGAAQAMLAISPFFDRASSRRFLAAELRTAFSGFDELTIATDTPVRRQLSRSHFAGVSHSVLRLIPEDLSKAELERIARSNDLADLGPRVIQRKLHAKVLALHDGVRTLVYVGSANFTCKAWLGDNRELGVAWLEDQPWPALVERLCGGVTAGSANAFSTLGNKPEVEPLEDEDYEGSPTWPDFVQGVTLEFTAGRDTLQFVVRGHDLHRLAEYEVRWGNERLSFTGGVSQPLSANTLFGRLLGGRNLAFRPQVVPTTTHWIPFRHEPQLFAERESMVHVSAEEWMAYQLGLERALPLHANEFDPDSEESGDDEGLPPQTHGDREANAMVRMQGYLSLFDRTERDFIRRAQTVLSLPSHERDAAWQHQVTTPLLTLARLLGRTGASMSEPEAVFKLGELVQLARELARIAPERPLPDVWAVWTAAPANRLLNEYLDEWRTSDGARV